MEGVGTFSSAKEKREAGMVLFELIKPEPGRIFLAALATKPGR